jgi:hypothetical protein
MYLSALLPSSSFLHIVAGMKFSSGLRHDDTAAGFQPSNQTRKGIAMLYTIAVVLVILWLIGLVSSYTIGGFIHVLLVIAIVIVLLRVISGRKPL